MILQEFAVLASFFGFGCAGTLVAFAFPGLPDGISAIPDGFISVIT